MEQQSSRAPDAPATFSTVTLSPALDVTLSCRKFPEPGDVITGFSEIETPGGKGLNAARWLAMRGHPVVYPVSFWESRVVTHGRTEVSRDFREPTCV